MDSLIAFLNSLTEEGVKGISTYAERIGAPTDNKNPQNQTAPIKCGLISTIAKDFLIELKEVFEEMD